MPGGPGRGQRGGRQGAQSKLRRLGLQNGQQDAAASAAAAAAAKKQLTFEIFFPRLGGSSPYRGAQYRAARGKDGLYNFVGLVLGHGGATVQRIQRASGAKIEVRDSAGNLNGAHPSSHADPSLHAWVAAASRHRLEKAVTLLLDVLTPTNTALHPVSIAPGGCVVLEPVVASDWLEAADAEVLAAAAAHEAAATAASISGLASPCAAANAWASNRLLGQRGPGDYISPLPSPLRAPGAPTLSHSSSSTSEADEEEAAAMLAGDPCLGSGGPDSPASVVPPPPPPRRCQEASSPLPAGMSCLPAHEQPSMATVWASMLHQDAPLQTGASANCSASSAPELSCSSGSSAASNSSWSLWEQGSSSSSFYEQLQAAANDTFACAAAQPVPALSAPLASSATFGSLHPLGLGGGIGSNSGVVHAQQQQKQQHFTARTGQPLAPPPATQQQLPAPFPGLVRPALGPSYGGSGLPLGFPSHTAGMGAGMGMSLGMPVGTPSLFSGQLYTAHTAAAPASDAEHDMQRLLAAVASMATLE